MSNELTMLPAPMLPATADQSVIADELVTDEGTFGRWPLADIRISKTNRKRFNQVKLDQLAASIKTKGVAQPILIRPVAPTADEPQLYEIVAGERRFRASIIAGMRTIPAMCRVLSDVEALELQILENLQRDNPHPLEEAEGYERLMMKHGYNADQLAEKLNKSRSYIYGRLKLCALNLEVRETFLDNEDALQASTALLIARIPLPKLQTKALNEILRPNGRVDDEPMSYRKAKEWLQKNYMLDLRKAIFLVDDSKLLKAAGSCNKCQKRAGNQPEVFEGVDPNLCTDPDCFKEKTAAHHDRLFANAMKQQLPVHEGAEAVATWGAIYRAGSDLVGDDTPLYTFERIAPHTGMSGTVSSRLKKAELPPIVAYVRSQDGVMEALYSRAAVQAAMEQAGLCKPQEAEQTSANAVDPDDADDIDAHGADEEAQVAGQDNRPTNAQLAQEATDKRISDYRSIRQHAWRKHGMSLQMIREVAKLLVRDPNNGLTLPDDLCPDLYKFSDRSDEGLCSYIDQAEYTEIEFIMMDLIIGNYLQVAAFELPDSHDDPGQVAIRAMMAEIKPDDTPSQDGSEAADQEPARITLKLKPKAQTPTSSAQSEGPIIKIKKHRAAVVPAAAWPFPTGGGEHKEPEETQS